MYNFKKIEKKWQKYWAVKKIHEAEEKSRKPKFYCLDMFPYPSGDGLHVGHVEGYTASDIMARYFRMKGYNVLHPMGWDAFGLPAENYAIKNKIHPKIAVSRNIKRFKKQLESIGFSYDWSREINTTEPEYYKWTQWIFLKLFEKGLAYEAMLPINWCPSCKTGLANEEVVDDKCERCGTAVTKKNMRQWVLKITDYAERLLEDLDGLDWPEKIKLMQRNWIGKSVGAEIKFKIISSVIAIRQPAEEQSQNNQDNHKIASSPRRGGAPRNDDFIEVFTTRADTLFGATYIVLAPEHPIIQNLIRQPADKILNLKEIENYIEKTKQKSERERIAETEKEKTGVELKGVKAVNPANGEELPIFIADYVLASYGTGAVMAVPAHDERDFAFAKKHGLAVKKVILPKPLLSVARNAEDIAAGGLESLRAESECFTEDGELANSGRFSGLSSEKAREEITKWLGEKNLAAKKINYRLRDWIFSRQRYWGEPIPLIFCENCKKQAEKLKVKFSDGELLNSGWIAVLENQLPVELPKVKSYEPTGTGESPLANIEKWVNVKCPKCGGEAKRETNTMPQWAGSCWYYLAFLLGNKKLKIKNKKLTDKEFGKIFDYWTPVDLYIGGVEHAVLHLLYARFWHKFLYDIGAVPTKEPFQKLVNQGLILGPDGQKMSKSRGNVINPDEVVKQYGADALRMYEMFMGPLEDAKPWDTKSITGVYRFLSRTYNLKDKIAKKAEPSGELEKLTHKTIKKVTEDIENFHFNTAISAMMVLLNEMEKQQELSVASCKLLVKILAPFAPHLAEELWKELGGKKSIHLEKWPEYDPKLVKEEIFTLIVQINGKVRGQIEAPIGISQKEALDSAMSDENVKKWLAGKEIKKIIFVPDKLMNIVINP